MSRKSESPGRQAGELAPDDAALWERVTRGATPLASGKNRIAREQLPETPASETPRQAPPRPARSDGARRQPKREPARVPPPVGYDRRESRRLASGRADIDARIDLHGLRQREAHRVLGAFLADAQARGHRHVLVITGKGGARDRAGPADFPDAGVQPGVLRRAVPQWLDGDALRPIVVGYTQAAPRHGGEGAFYVRLRKAGR